MTITPLTAACLALVSLAYQVPEADLWILLDVERGRVGEVSKNKNGTVDIGPFQINEIWLPSLQKLWSKRSREDTYIELRDNGCANAEAAASIYKHHLEKLNGNRSQALGHYHSRTPVHRDRYLRLVEASRKRLYGGSRY